MNIQSKNTQIIKSLSAELGFMRCGISSAKKLDKEEKHLENWLNENRNGKMAYMENHFEKRLDPSKLVPGAKSVISLSYNYFTDESQKEGSPKISKYAYGVDYHKVIKKKLKEFMFRIQEEIGTVGGRIFVDSAPLLEKALAAQSGLGWIGKNSNLIHPKSGSFFFLCELVLDIDLIPDDPMTDYCGTCTACIEACPTDAIYEPYKVDGSKCISYFTIELKDSIPTEMKGQFENWMFGCDICQDVCPWNRFSKKHNEPLFDPNPVLLNMDSNDWKEITEEIFDEIFFRSPVKRTKYSGLKRNIAFLDD